MVTITKPTKHNNAILCKKIIAAISLLILLWLGTHWLAWFHTTFFEDDNNDHLRRKQQSLPKIKGILQPSQEKDKQANLLKTYQHEKNIGNILSNISQLSTSIALPTDISTKYTTSISKECIPGRDDSNNEINPTTHRKRECLRHVPLGKHHDQVDLKYSMLKQKPRIGIMITPNFISHTIANFIKETLVQTSEEIHFNLEILITSSVPVYGYGKSHGYTKLIRINVMPLSLSVVDTYLYTAGMVLKKDEEDESSSNDLLKDTIDEMKLGRRLGVPSIGTVGMILSLVMRWNCRMSHVSAHTAMLTLSAEDIIKDPTDSLASILAFIWREDWDWEGHGGQQHPHQSKPHATWKIEADEIVNKQYQNDDSVLNKLFEYTSLLLDETTSSIENNDLFKKSIQGAFASEMSRSSDMTSWPCPSFWEGVDTTTITTDGDDDDQQNRILQHISSEMIPNCRDNDPFVRCTVNRDRCEVGRDAKCK